ncbi:MAG TPA: hypothetical protein VGK00_10330 [Anaerolineales bacterium]
MVDLSGVLAGCGTHPAAYGWMRKHPTALEPGLVLAGCLHPAALELGYGRFEPVLIFGLMLCEGGRSRPCALDLVARLRRRGFALSAAGALLWLLLAGCASIQPRLWRDTAERGRAASGWLRDASNRS